MAMALNYPPEGLKALLTLFGVDGLVNNFMQEADFSVDEFIKANDGNLFFALSDFGGAGHIGTELAAGPNRLAQAQDGDGIVAVDQGRVVGGVGTLDAQRWGGKVLPARAVHIDACGRCQRLLHAHLGVAGQGLGHQRGQGPQAGQGLAPGMGHKNSKSDKN